VYSWLALGDTKLVEASAPDISVIVIVAMCCVC